jgi:hypothetical protein
VPGSEAVHATWASAPPEGDLAFDVERRMANGEWVRILTATRKPSIDFAAGGAGTVWSVRARLRSASDPSRATDWSPVATIIA